MTDTPAPTSDATPPRDYSDTLNLPETQFPMRAGLPQKEPQLIARWDEMRLYEKLRQTAKRTIRENLRFLLRGGPAAQLHIGRINAIREHLPRGQSLFAGFVDPHFWPRSQCEPPLFARISEAGAIAQIPRCAAIRALRQNELAHSRIRVVSRAGFLARNGQFIYCAVV